MRSVCSRIRYSVYSLFVIRCSFLLIVVISARTYTPFFVHDVPTTTTTTMYISSYTYRCIDVYVCVAAAATATAAGAPAGAGGCKSNRENYCECDYRLNLVILVRWPNTFNAQDDIWKAVKSHKRSNDYFGCSPAAHELRSERQR